MSYPKSEQSQSSNGVDDPIGVKNITLTFDNIKYDLSIKKENNSIFLK